MGTKANPGQFDCYSKLEEDEPFFVLRANDPLAPEIVRTWARQREAVHGPSEKVDEARRCAEAMWAWWLEHRHPFLQTPAGGEREVPRA